MSQGFTGVNDFVRGYWMLQVQGVKLYPSNSAARIDAGTAVWRLLFSSTTQQYGVWQFLMPNDYNSNPTMRISWGVDSGMSVARSVTWLVDQWSYTPFLANTSIYVDTYGGANSFALALSAGYSSGTVQFMTIPLATVVSMGANNLTKLRISVTGGYVGNAELYGAMLDYQRD